MPNFKFLTIAENRVVYSVQQVKQKRNSRKQIALYFKWLLVEFVKSFLKKYKLQLAKVNLIDSSNTVDELEIEITQTTESVTSERSLEKLRLNLRQYAKKELSNLSDAAWQSFINAGTNFAGLRFI